MRDLSTQGGLEEHHGTWYAPMARLGLAVMAAALVFDCVALAVDIVAGRRIVDGVPVEEIGLDYRSSLSSLANLAVPAAAVIGGTAFVWWFYDAYRRMQESGTKVGSGRQPIWAVIGWLIPAVNLITPPTIMAVLAVPADGEMPVSPWQSHPQRDPKLQRVMFWWILLVGGVGVQVALRVITPETQKGWIDWQSTALMADLVLLASLWLAALLVSDVERRLVPPMVRV